MALPKPTILSIFEKLNLSNPFTLENKVTRINAASVLEEILEIFGKNIRVAFEPNGIKYSAYDYVNKSPVIIESITLISIASILRSYNINISYQCYIFPQTDFQDRSFPELGGIEDLETIILYKDDIIKVCHELVNITKEYSKKLPELSRCLPLHAIIDREDDKLKFTIEPEPFPRPEQFSSEVQIELEPYNLSFDKFFPPTKKNYPLLNPELNYENLMKLQKTTT